MLFALLTAVLSPSLQDGAPPPGPLYGGPGPRYLVINVDGQVPPNRVEDFEAGLEQTIARMSRGLFTPAVDLVDVSFPEPTGASEPKLVTTRREAFAHAVAAGADPAGYGRVAVLVDREYFNEPGFNVCLGTVDRHVVFCDQWDDGPTGPGGLPTPVLLMHELGHSYGWGHSTYWDPASAASPIENGEEVGRGDVFDVMGGRWSPFWTSPLFHYFNPWYMLRVGWLLPEEVRELDENTVNTTVLLRPLEAPPPPPGVDVYPSAIRIRRSGSTTFAVGPQVPDHWTDYWIFWRKYEWAENPLLPGAHACAEGPVIHLGHRTSMGRSILLDMHPGGWAAAPFEDAPFVAEGSFTDSGLTVTFDGLADGLAQVTVELPPGYAAPALPPRIAFDVSTFPAPASSATGDTWTFAVDATDPEGGAIESVEFWLFPNEDEILAHLSKSRLPNGTLPYPETFPRVQSDVPSALESPPLFVAASTPGQVVVSGSRYEWTAPLEAGGVHFDDGVHHLVVRAVTAGSAPRANLDWRPFVVDQSFQ